MLKLENVTKYYHSSSNVTCALRKINLEFKKGEFVVITGESGSGKTTLLNILSGLDSYEDGEMFFNNQETSYFDETDWENYRRNEIAFIFQNYNLIDSYTVLENVMVTYTIAGYSLNEAKEKATNVIKLVGLESHMHQKGTQLSGGQKQKVAIARALAKETNIIIADEPTGNLDTENSLMILELLKKVSKDKLVILVSHNQNIVDPFMTRKIRLRDGEVVSDEIITEAAKEEIIETKNNEIVNKNKNFNFLFLNLKSQPKKSILLLLLITFSIIATFVCVLNFKTNIDDKKTQNLSYKFFNNLDDKRLLIKRSDGSNITDQMLNSLNHEYIASVDKFDYITDINYYRPGDYKYKYAGGLVDNPATGGTDLVDNSSYVAIKQDKFMRSASSLTADMLKAGRLPVNNREMVIYSDDLSVLDTEEFVLFRNAFKWGSDTWYRYNVKIVGILKEPTKQAYFSDDICRVLELTNYTLNIRFNYTYKEYGRIDRSTFFTFDKIVMVDDINLNEFRFTQLALNQMKDNKIKNVDNTIVTFKDHTYSQKSIYSTTDPLKIADNAIGVSKDFFDMVYNQYEHYEQAALFITDYAYIDEVMDYLYEEGYDVISCFQVSVTGYNKDKVIIRLVNLIASIVGIVVINLIVIFVAYSFLKIKKNDYVIFKMLGLSNKDSKIINRYELLLYTIIGNLILIITTLLIRLFTNNLLILELYKYLKFYDYFIVLFISILSSLLLSNSFGKFITRSAKITVLKEE